MLGGETRAAFGVVEVDDADLDHAAFARRSHLLRHQLLAFGTLLVLFDLLHLDAFSMRKKWAELTCRE